MSKNDFIYCEKGAFSKESCDDYIKFFEDNIGIASPGGMQNKNSVNDLEICLDIEKCDRNLNDCIVKVFESYKKIYPLIDTRLGSWNCYHKCQLMRYEPNKYYDIIHCETDCAKPTVVERCFAWMICLNDIKKGGGTEFIHQKVITKPRLGDMYIWPSGWTHMHRGVNAPYEVKYIITGWINFI
jgi:hypothetical protein